MDPHVMQMEMEKTKLELQLQLKLNKLNYEIAIAKIQAQSKDKSKMPNDALAKEANKPNTLGLIPSQKEKAQAAKPARTAAGHSNPKDQPTAKSKNRGQPTADQNNLFRPPKQHKQILDQPTKNLVQLRSKRTGKNPSTIIDEFVEHSTQVEDDNPVVSLRLRPEPPAHLEYETKATGYLKNRRFLLSERNIKPWKSSPSHQNTKEQKALLNIVWNHIRAGTMDPVPVRLLEKEFSKMNKLVSTSVQIADKKRRAKWEPYSPESARKRISKDEQVGQHICSCSPESANIETDLSLYEEDIRIRSIIPRASGHHWHPDAAYGV